MTKIYKCQAKKLQDVLESLNSDSSNFSHKGLYNDLDWGFKSGNKWVVDKENNGDYVLYSTISPTGLNDFYFGSYKAIIKMIDDENASLRISLKGYITYMILFVMII